MTADSPVLAPTLIPRPGASHPSIGRRLLPYLLIAPPVILVALLIFFPAIQSAIRTLTPDDPASGAFTLIRYQAFFQDPTQVASLVYTVEFDLAGLIFLLALGLGLSLYLRFRKNRLSGFVQGLAIFPLFVPGIILAYALIQFLGPRGTVDNLIRLTGTRPMLDAVYHFFGLVNGFRVPYLHPEAVVIGVVWEGLPFTVLILTAGLGQVDDSVIESARDVGANGWQVFRRIILPLIERPLLIVFCLNFIGIFGSYTLPYLLGPAAPQSMGVLMENTYNEFQEPLQAQVQAVMTFLACAIVGLLYIRTIIRQRAGQERFQ